MLIQITNSCSMGCRHCLQDSKVGDFHMTNEIIDKVISFIKKTPTKVINLSGGEPSEHPKFLEIVERFAKEFPADRGFTVAILSNGTFIFDEYKSQRLKELFEEHDCLMLQVSTHKDYYPRYKEIIAKEKEFRKIDILAGLAFNPIIYVHTLGRAANDELCIKKASFHKYTTSCLMATSTWWQLPFNEAINNMQYRGHYCTPLIDWQGNIHLSESWLCPNIGSIDDYLSNTNKFKQIVKQKPCGKCLDYQKILANNTPIYTAIKSLMEIK